MLIQLSDQDNAKDVLEFENNNTKGSEISTTVELLRSHQLLLIHLRLLLID